MSASHGGGAGEDEGDVSGEESRRIPSKYRPPKKKPKRKLVANRFDYLPEEALDWLPLLNAIDSIDTQGIQESELILPRLIDDEAGHESDEHQTEAEHPTASAGLGIVCIEPEEAYHSNSFSVDEEEDYVPREEEDDFDFILEGALAAAEGGVSEFGEKTQNLYQIEDKEQSDDDVAPLEELAIGLEWDCMQDCREQLRNYAIRKRFVMKQVKNKSAKQHYKCGDENCKWFIYCSKLGRAYIRGTASIID